ncbi:LamG-like jellyroll fold domain-containing protein [Microbacterium sp. ZW T6_19]|uniref:LamG-like jellyroll fold domain-containing protein n=1 Tax=Microbacterium sp. ZW T6_19 TaxID=3378082 RepID=UPI003855003F
MMKSHAVLSRFRAVAALALVSVAASALTVSPVAPAAAADAAAPRSGLVAEYLFSQTSGASVANTAGSGVGAATVVNGTDAHWTGSSLAFIGGAKTSTTADWVRLPDGILAGENSATITVETKFDASMLSTWHFLWNIGSDSTSSYWFASLKDVPRTAITTSGNGGEKNARGTAALTADRWYSVTSVIDGNAGTISFYVDGQLLGSTATRLTPASLTAQTVNAIGRSPYPDPFFQGEVSAFRVYDRALTAAEVADVSTADAALHSSGFQQYAQSAVDALNALTLDDATTTLPASSTAALSWSSQNPDITVAADGRTASVRQPAAGSAAIQTTLTATATVRGVTVSREVPVTIEPAPAQTDDYGYLMVHFIEDSEGYAEKIYLDISRGDDPEQWDPLNGGKPILASHLGTTGVRDPFLTRNPETGTYYIIATDLRVFGGDNGSGSCTSWCYWTKSASTRLIVWESDDLVTWSAPRSFDTALNSAGAKVAELGMAWAPEALWVDDYYPDGRGAFVMYFSANVFQTADHSDSSYNRVVWGATTDFTQATYSYGGDFVNTGANTIDTTMIQDGGTTYRITKDNGTGDGIYMESTTAARWWESGTAWTTLQTKIGAAWAGGNAGGVEGPAVFKSHSDEKWYLYVDVIPSTGYRPMVTTDLDAGWSQLNSPTFFMTPSTKHGGVISLTKADYDRVRAADAAAAVTNDLGAVEIAAGSSSDQLAAALPQNADVVLAYARGTATRPVTWNTASVDLATAGTYPVTGTVQTIGANLNTWTGAGGSTAWNAPDRTLASSTAVTVTAQVTVTAPALSVTATAGTRCVAGKVIIVTEVVNKGGQAVTASVTTAYGTQDAGSIAPGKKISRTTTTRLGSIPAGQVSVSATVQGATTTVTADYAARTCAG